MVETSQEERMISINVVVPCYNCTDVLDRAVMSLVSQEKTGVDWRIILVDDGSTDGTDAKCDRYALDYSNIKVIHKKNGGLVSAWKAGVAASDADYIVFCDADDYLDTDLVKRVAPILLDYAPEVVLYGLVMEYEDSSRQKYEARIPEGMYVRESIEKEWLPTYFSNGKMQSGIMPCMRVCKVFERELLTCVMKEVSEAVSTGEDRLTSFVMVLQCASLYVMNDYYPYHYVRTDASMIGGYDPERFKKLSQYFDALEQIADKHKYEYHDQIAAEELSLLFLYMKKEIERNPNGFKVVRNTLRQERHSDRFVSALKKTDISRYQRKAKTFAWLVIQEWYWMAYCIVKLSQTLKLG